MDRDNEIIDLLKETNETYKGILNELEEADRVSIMPYLTTSMDDIIAELSQDGKEIIFTIKIVNEGNAAAVNPHVRPIETKTGGTAIAVKDGDVPRYSETTPMDRSILAQHGKKAVFQASVIVEKLTTQYNNFMFNVQFADLRGQLYSQWFQVIYTYANNAIQLLRRVVELPVKEK